MPIDLADVLQHEPYHKAGTHGKGTKPKLHNITPFAVTVFVILQHQLIFDMSKAAQSSGVCLPDLC